MEGHPEVVATTWEGPGALIPCSWQEDGRVVVQDQSVWDVPWEAQGFQEVRRQDVVAGGIGPCGMYHCATEFHDYYKEAEWHMEAYVGGNFLSGLGDAGSAPAQVYTGFLKTFSPKDGYGFIDCPALFDRFGRDVFIHAMHVPSGLSCGQCVSFSIDLNKRGQPQAKNVLVCEEPASLEEMSDACNHLLLTKMTFEMTPVRGPRTARNACWPVRICSWNMLAAAYANCKAYPDVRHSVLRWPWRRPLLTKSLHTLNAEVFCLQEVDCALAEFALPDYDHVCAPRPGGRRDQCIVAWKRAHFRLRGHQPISFDDYITPEVAYDAEQLQRFHRGNCAVVVELDDIVRGEPIVIATAHLCWAAEHEDVRAWQMRTLLAILQPYREGPCKHRVVLCGDINALPGLLTHRCAAETLTSVYADVEAIAVTNSNSSVSPNGFAEMIDHMFFDPRGATVVSRLRLPSRHELRKWLPWSPQTSPDAVPTLLCDTWPSDHLPVAAELVFTFG